MADTLTTCTACGCTCDDIRLAVNGDGNATAVENACELGNEWFAVACASGPAASIDGAAASLDDAVAKAAELLGGARLPLVAGLRFATTEAMRAAVALADRLGGCVDWTCSAADEASTLALQTVGGVTATLGEVAQRADVVLAWGADLATTHPRHFERYSLEPASPWIAGRGDRTLISVDQSRTETAEQADHVIQIKPGSDVEAAMVLRAVVRGIDLDAVVVEQQTGVPLDEWRALVERMQGAKFGAVVYGGAIGRCSAALGALTELMADLTAHTRWVSVSAGGPGNAAGAANVLAWQTGFPLGVHLAHRYPQYGPGEWTADAVLSRGEADVALVVGDDLAGRLSPAAAAHLKSIPTIAIDWRDTATTAASQVVIRTARPGVECGGTTYRVDGVAVPLRAATASKRPPAEQVLARLATQCDDGNGLF